MTIANAKRRIAGALLLVLGLLAGIEPTTAATWIVDDASGIPGETFDLPIRFRGDGRTSAADITVVLDPARLTIDAPTGELPDAARDGRCGWNGSDEVNALVFSDSTKPLSSDETLVCLLRVRIRPTAPASRVTLRANAAHCAIPNGQGGTCSVVPGSIRIDGPPPEPRPAPSDALALVVLLQPNAPSALSVVEAGAAHSDVEGLRRMPPLALRALFATPDPDRTDLPPQDLELQARLARYLVAEYASLADRDAALDLLLADPLVVGASPDTEMQLAAGGGPALAKGLLPQQHTDDLGLEALWQYAGGWGLIGAVDTGITAEHVELRSFTGPGSTSGTWVPGGNYLAYFSSNVGLKGQPVDDLSETQPSQTDATDTCGNTQISPPFAGHGTHVSGLLSANADDESGTSGACKHCGVGMRKYSSVACVEGFGPVLKFYSSNFAAGIEANIRDGIQALNLSLAAQGKSCHINGQTDIAAICDAIAYAGSRDIVVLAAAGNNLSMVGFPATDPRVMAIGGIFGLDQANAPVWWTESPNCPLPPSPPLSNPECGSNFRQGSMPGNPPAFTNYIELVAPAKSITSTFVPGWDWNDGIACGDSHDGTDGDGFGPCTGTSMSTPQISGIAGVLRSIHPLLTVGTPWISPPTGLRGLLRSTASRSLAGLGNDPRIGFGVPNAALAAERLLGTVGSEVARNRAILLFGLYSPGLDDYAAVVTPQLALALGNVTPATKAYRSSHQQNDTFVEGLPIPGYVAFPGAGAGAPRALAFVLATEHSRAGLPTPTPLYLMARPRAQATAGDDHILVDTSLVQKAANAGYALAGRQGYIYPWCTTPSCNPVGTQALHLKCKNAGNPTTRRCAVFLKSQRPAFEAKSYTALFPGATRSQLGFAYAVADADNDGLVDAAEHVIGTSPMHPDSDGDNKNDIVEYPLQDIPVSDPCNGPAIKCPHILNRVFKDGFE